MAKPSSSSVVSRPGVREHTVKPARVILVSLFLLALLVLAFYAIGGWYFSGRIHTDALQVHPPEAGPLDITFDRGAAATVVLRGDPDAQNLLEEGRFGLMWDSGESVVGGIVSSDTAGGTATVFRERIAAQPIPAPGSSVRLDGFVWSGNPQTALGIPFQEIRFPVDGGTAGAWYVEGTTDTWMIFVHGKGAPRNEALRLLPLAVERGYHAMVIDYRNDPSAPPDPSGFYQYGVTEWGDVAAAARYARSNGADDLVAVGYSMGGANVVSFILRSPLRAQTAAVILDSPVLDFESTIDFGASQTTLPLTSITTPSSLTSVAKWIASWRYDIDWDAADYLAQWRDYHTPTLLFQGTGDETVPLGPAQQFAGVRSDVVTFISPPDVGHVLAWNADPVGYESTVNSFLDGLGL